MIDELMVAFEDCLAALEKGATLDDCLRRFPDLAGDLQPMLTAAQEVNAAFAALPVPERAQEASRKRLLAQAAVLGGPASMNNETVFNSPARRIISGWMEALASLPGALRIAARRPISGILAACLLLVLLGVGVISVSAQSLPGTPLYGLKRSIEQTEIRLSPSAERRARLQDSFSLRRVQEARQVTQRGWTAPLDFGGPLDAINGEIWSVSGMKVIVLAGTPIQGSPQIGIYVWVQGIAQAGGSVQAQEVRVEGERFNGSVQAQHKDQWQVGGKLVLTSAHTVVESDPQVGDVVEVNAVRLPGGELMALHITLMARNSGGTKGGPQATQPGPVVSVTPSPSETASPTPDDGEHGNHAKDKKTPGPAGGGDGLPPTYDPHGGGRGPAATQTPGPGQPHGGSSTPMPGRRAGQEVRFTGTLQSMTAGIWLVGGQVVTLRANTKIDGRLQVGDTVEVRAVRQADGDLVATQIKKR